MNPSFRSVRFCYRLNATAGLGLARHRPLCENISLLCDSQLSLPTQNRAFGLASNADRLAKTHPSILIFCENRFFFAKNAQFFIIPNSAFRIPNLINRYHFDLRHIFFKPFQLTVRYRHIAVVVCDKIF